MAIFDVLHKIWYLVPNHFSQELSTNLDPQLSKVLNIMILRKSVSFLNDSRRVRGKKIQFQESISNFLSIFLLIITGMLLFLILAEPSANSKSIIEIIVKLPAID